MKNTALILLFGLLLFGSCTVETSYVYRLHGFYAFLADEAIINDFKKGELKPVIAYIENNLTNPDKNMPSNFSSAYNDIKKKEAITLFTPEMFVNFFYNSIFKRVHPQ